MKTDSVGRYIAICFLAAIVLALCVQFVDRPVADFTAAHVPSEPPIHFALKAELLIVPFGIIWVLGCGIAVALGYALPHLVRTTMLASFSLTWALSANYFLLQPFFGRTDISRYLKDHDAYGFVLSHGHSGIGFPSGHTIIAASFLVVFWLAYPRARIVLGLVIAAVMFGLVIAQWHFLSDTLGGLFVGAIAAILTMRLLGRETIDQRGRVTSDLE